MPFPWNFTHENVFKAVRVIVKVMNWRGITSLILAVYLLAASVEAKRVLVYEVGTSSQYTIEGQYGKFAEELRKRGYEVASIEKGELTKDKLENYDVLVIQDLNKQLTTGEISAIIWFVLQQGRGLFINGGGQGKANQLTIPFGVTVDNGLLIDTTDQIPNLKDRNSFTIDRFLDYSMTATIRHGVTRIGFYKDAGIMLSGSSKCIATGNQDTYSDTGSFAAGSEPCVAAASIFGSGLVFTLSDIDMFGNKYINDYNNKNFGLNIIDWLSISTDETQLENSTTELVLQIKEMRLENTKLQQQIKQVSDEKADLTGKFQQISAQNRDLQQQLDDIQNGMIGPFNRSNWAIIILGACILLAAIAYSRNKSTEIRIKDEDILSELGYELDSGKQAKPGEAPKEPENR